MLAGREENDLLELVNGVAYARSTRTQLAVYAEIRGGADMRNYASPERLAEARKPPARRRQGA